MRLPVSNGVGAADVVIGRVVLVHVDDAYILPDGRVDIVKIRPLARLGYYDYTMVDSAFEMTIPGSDERMMGGLEGDARRTRG